MSDDPIVQDEDRARATELAAVICEAATEQERGSLVDWLQNLLTIAQRDGSKLDKARRAVEATLRSEVVWPIVKVMGREIKRHAWDERSSAFLLGGGGALAALAIGGGEAGAGIVALGTGIGVPLWIVFGAGGAFAGTLLDEIQKIIAAASYPSSQDQSHFDQAPDVDTAAPSGSTDSDAFATLGLPLGASEEEILSAHRRLIARVHPDVGGSAYLAAQLNQARETALQYARSSQ